MNITTVTIDRIFSAYQRQSRIAELIDENSVKRVQDQRDEVSISKEARAALALHMVRDRLQKLETRNEKVEVVEAEGKTENKENLLHESEV